MDREYKMSFGNLAVLQMVPRMMLDSKYRRKLRLIYLDYMVELGHTMKEVDQYDPNDKKQSISY